MHLGGKQVCSVVFPPISPATGLSLLQSSGSCVVPTAGSPVVPDATRGLSSATPGLSCLQAFARPVLCEKGQAVITQHSADAVVASSSGAHLCSPLLIWCQPFTNAVVALPSLPQCSPLFGCQPPTNAVVPSPSVVSQCSPLLIGCQPPTNAVVTSPSVVPQCSSLLIGCQPPTNAVVASPSVVPQCSPLLIGCQPPTNAVVTSPSVVPQCSPLLIGCQPPTNAVVASPSVVPQCSPLLIGCQPPTNAVVASPSVVPQCSPLLIGCQPPTNAVVASPSVVPQCSPLLIGCQPPTNAFGYHPPTNPMVASPSAAPQCSPMLTGCHPPTSTVVASPSVAYVPSSASLASCILASEGYPSPASGYYPTPSSAYCHSLTIHPRQPARNVTLCYLHDQSLLRVHVASPVVFTGTPVHVHQQLLAARGVYQQFVTPVVDVHRPLGTSFVLTGQSAYPAEQKEGFDAEFAYCIIHFFSSSFCWGGGGCQFFSLTLPWLAYTEGIGGMIAEI